jgi:hypothetical protein
MRGIMIRHITVETEEEVRLPVRIKIGIDHVQGLFDE